MTARRDRLSMGDITIGIPTQMQVFRISARWMIFASIGISFLAAAFAWLMLLPFLGERTYPSGTAVLLFLLGAIPLLFIVCFFPWIFKSRIEVYPDRIKYFDFLMTRELLIDEIDGFRVIPTHYTPILLVLPRNPKTKKIKAALVFKNQAGLFEWLNRNLNNLDELDSQEEMTRVLSDTQLGETSEQRLYMLARAKMWSRILSVLCLAAMLWAILKPQPYHYAIWSCLILPLVVLGFARHFHGVLKFEDDIRKTALPNIYAAFILPGFGLALRAIVDFNILNRNKFWIPFACLSVSLYLFTLLTTRGARRKVATAIGLILFCAVYGYGAVVCLNGILDTSKPSVYMAQVLAKRVSTGQHPSFYLKLSPWGQRQEEKEVYVARSVYDKHEIGDGVRVIVRKGRLEIPWFYVL
jgi:hypothetical protein